MVLHNLVIYNRLGIAVYYEDFNRKRPSPNLAHELNLLYGMLYSFKMFVAKTSPKPQEETNGFRYFKTSAYKLHYFETASGYRIVLNSDPATGDLREQLKRIYELLVDYVVKNPLFEVNDPIKSELFISKLSQYLQSLPCYTST